MNIIKEIKTILLGLVVLLIISIFFYLLLVTTWMFIVLLIIFVLAISYALGHIITKEIKRKI